MESIIIARLLGPLMLVSAAAILLNRKGIQQTVGNVAKNPGTIYLAGVMTLLAGLSIVELHNVWSGWQAVITVLGWLMVVSGTARMLIPDQLSRVGGQLVKQAGTLEISAVISALFGVLLTIKGFE